MLLYLYCTFNKSIEEIKIFIPGEIEYPYPQVCAHRGYNKVLPESSLAAFGAAVGLGVPDKEKSPRRRHLQRRGQFLRRRRPAAWKEPHRMALRQAATPAKSGRLPGLKDNS